MKLLRKLNSNEPKIYWIICGLKACIRKNNLVAKDLTAYENYLRPIKTAEVVARLKVKCSKKLVINDKKLPYLFKIPHGCQNDR